MPIVSLNSDLVAARTPETTVQTGIELGSECVEPRVLALPNG